MVTVGVRHIARLQSPKALLRARPRLGQRLLDVNIAFTYFGSFFGGMHVFLLIDSRVTRQGQLIVLALAALSICLIPALVRVLASNTVRVAWVASGLARSVCVGGMSGC